MAEPQIEIEIVWPRLEGPRSWRLRLPAGSTAADALATVVLAEGWSQDPFEEAPLGVFSRRIEPAYVLQGGDRLEIYRSLQVDPKDARRRRASRSR
jgi:putative ubiquitin-RnfH superfamily antitoxin RatB of RatAB toxin-antitoxin module